MKKSFIERHPVITTIITVVVLVFMYGFSGAVLMQTKNEMISPVFVPNIIITVAVLLWAWLSKKRQLIYLNRPKQFTGKGALMLYGPYVFVVLLTAVTSLWVNKWQLASTNTTTLGYLVLLAIVVGMVEELIFRGILLRAWSTKGVVTAVIITSALFGLVHLSQLMGEQTGAMTFLQMAFAVFFAVVSAQLVFITGSILPTILLHILFDGVQLITTDPTATNTADVSLNPIALTTTIIIVITFIAVAVYQQKRLPKTV